MGIRYRVTAIKPRIREPAMKPISTLDNLNYFDIVMYQAFPADWITTGIQPRRRSKWREYEKILTRRTIPTVDIDIILHFSSIFLHAIRINKCPKNPLLSEFL